MSSDPIILPWHRSSLSEPGPEGSAEDMDAWNLVDRVFACLDQKHTIYTGVTKMSQKLHNTLSKYRNTQHLLARSLSH